MQLRLTLNFWPCVPPSLVLGYEMLIMAKTLSHWGREGSSQGIWDESLLLTTEAVCGLSGPWHSGGWSAWTVAGVELERS